MSKASSASRWTILRSAERNHGGLVDMDGRSLRPAATTWTIFLSWPVRSVLRITLHMPISNEDAGIECYKIMSSPPLDSSRESTIPVTLVLLKP